MQIDYAVTFGLTEACVAIGIQSDEICAIVEHGIVAPEGEGPEDWLFNLDMICTAKRATRMQQDLHLDWSAIALLISLLEERDRLRNDNAQLRLQLQRFLNE